MAKAGTNRSTTRRATSKRLNHSLLNALTPPLPSPVCSTWVGTRDLPVIEGRERAAVSRPRICHTGEEPST
jgi:hypothetical protein